MTSQWRHKVTSANMQSIGQNKKIAKNVSSIRISPVFFFLLIKEEKWHFLIYTISFKTIQARTFFFKMTISKWCVPIALSSSRAQPELVLFWCQMKAHNVSHYNPKISASNSLYFVCYRKVCTYFRYTIFNFLMYFHNSLIWPQCHILIFAPGVIPIAFD